MTWLPKRALGRLEGALREDEDTLADRGDARRRALSSGDRIDDRFQVDDFIGSGGMGTVHRGRDLSTGRAVAIKVLHELDHASRRRFQRETAILASLVHPRIVPYVAHGRTGDGEPYLVTTLLDGETVGQALLRGRLAPALAVRLARLACEPLGHAHALGFVHRDIKPSNLFLVGAEVDGLCLLDFGLARPVATLEQLTGKNTRVGTPGYMAPEQARGREVSARADVFALGCVLFECLTGMPAFSAENEVELLLKIAVGDSPRLAAVAPDLPKALDALVARMTATDPARRPGDAREAGVALEAVERALVPVDSPGHRGLGASEQSIVSVIVASPMRAPPATDVAELDGDELVTAVAGAGSAAEQAEGAARSALAMRQAMPGHALAVATGRGVLRDGVPAGEAVDRGSLLARANGRSVARDDEHPPPVRIDELTAHLLGSRFELSRQGSAIWLWREGDVPDVPGTLLGRVNPLLGRGEELARVMTLVREAAASRAPRLACISGSAGVGKSRLLREIGWAARVAVPALKVLSARAEPLRSGARLGVLAQLVRSSGQLEDDATPGRRLSQLLERVARVMRPEVVTRARTFLAELLGLSDAGEPSEALRAARHDAMLMGDQLRRAWQDWLSSECQHGSVLILLDDAEWADHGSLACIAASLEARTDNPLVVVATMSADSLPSWCDGAERVELSGLAPTAIATMATRALGPGATPEVVGRIIEHAQGNALCSEELIRAAQAGETRALPAPLVAMVQARLEILPPESRRLLRAASVFGAAFWVGGVVALAGARADRLAIERLLDGLVSGEIVEPRQLSRFAHERELAFRHTMLREAAYASLTEDDRVLAHRLAAEWLESVAESDAIVIATHYEQARSPRQARQFYQRAAYQSLQGNDLAGAIDRAERALDCGPTPEERCELLLLQMEAHGWTGNYAEVERIARLVEELAAPGTLPWLTAMTRAAIAGSKLGRDEALERAVIALREALSSQPAEELVAEAGAMVAQLVKTGRPRLAAALADDLERAGATRARDPLVLARLEVARSRLSLHAGEIATSMRQRVAAIVHFDRAGDVRGACAERANLGFVLLEIGDPTEAAQSLRAAIATAAELGLSQISAVAQQNLGIALTRVGDAAQACTELEQAAASLRAQGDRRLTCYASAALADARMDRGDADGAELAARDALATAPATPARSWAQATLARVLLRRGRAEEALELARAAKASVEELGGIDGGEAFVPLVYAEALLGCGDIGAARSELTRAAARLRERAEHIRDEQLRASFLSGVPENARTLALARALTDPAE